jgi:sarcosine oxidase
VRPEVIVVGLGSMGAATAYQLASRGVRVLGLDEFTPPHPAGAHTGGSRIIRLAYAEGADYVPLLRRSYQLWGEVERADGDDLLTRTGGLMLGHADSSTVAGALASARVHGLDHELLDAAEIRRRFPAFAPGDDEVGVYEEAAGILRPEAAVTAFLRLAADAGADLRYGTRVTGWRADASGISVRTPDGELTADRLVLCPGAGAPGLLGDLGVPFEVQRRVQHYWAAPGAEFAVGRCPVWIWESEPGVTAYGMPALDRTTATDGTPTPAAGGNAPVAKTAFHSAVGPATSEADLGPTTAEERRRMMAWLAPRLPGLAAVDWLAGQPCRYTLTPDEHFVLGRHPGHANVSVAAGFSGHGFKFVPVVGEILADLAQTGATPHRIDLFAPDRFAGSGRSTSPGMTI